MEQIHSSILVHLKRQIEIHLHFRALNEIWQIAHFLNSPKSEMPLSFPSISLGYIFFIMASDWNSFG